MRSGLRLAVILFVLMGLAGNRSGLDVGGNVTLSAANLPFLRSARRQVYAERVLNQVAQRPGAKSAASIGAALKPADPLTSPPSMRSARPASADRVTIVVRGGNTLWDLARAYRTTIEAIAEVNRLSRVDEIQVGRQLSIPVDTASSSAPKHVRTVRPAAVVVRDGQTLWEIGLIYGVSVDAIVAANRLDTADPIWPGQRLVIPAQASRGTSVAESAPSRGASGIARGLLWPARGWISSRFGWRRSRRHLGIDIAAPRGAPIYAAKNGRVAFAGWYGGYGRVVIIDHGPTVRTLYAHASALLVRVGEPVRPGQLIARVGCTGRCTGPNLHFEVRINGRPLNPLQYL